MSQRFVFEEDRGWPVKIIRAVIWSGAMGVVWVLPWIALTLLGGLCFYLMPPVSDRSDSYDSWGIAVIYISLIFCGGLSFIFGSVVGLVVGVKARTEEAFWPFHSRFFQLALEWSVGISLLMVMAVIALYFAYAAPHDLF